MKPFKKNKFKKLKSCKSWSSSNFWVWTKYSAYESWSEFGTGYLPRIKFRSPLYWPRSWSRSQEGT